MELDPEFIKRVQRWRVDPAYWVSCTANDTVKFSNQQKHASDELGKIVAAKIMLSNGRVLTENQRKYANYIGIDISSGTGNGKDFWISWMMYWLLDVFPIENGQPPHGLATANTATQLSNVLWRQASIIPSMSKKLPSGKTILEEKFECQTKKIFLRESLGKSFFFEAVTVSPHATSDEQSRALTGRHAPYMLIIIDEAAGVPDAVFQQLEGTLSGRVNIAIMIYNPIRSHGYAVEARNKPDRWLSLNWNSEETFFDNALLDIPLQNKNRDLLTRYGRDSNVYRIRVLGLPPIESKDVFFPWEWVQRAVDNGLEPDDNDLVVIGVDPASGGDNSVIVVRKGCKIMSIKRFNEPDTMKFVKLVEDEIIKWEPVVTNIDMIGIGNGVYYRLKELCYRVHPADVRRTALDSRRFKNVRDELWQRLRDRFEKGLINIPNDQSVIDQLGCITIKDYARSGILVVPTKAQMKRDIGHSPDEVDGIMLTYAIPEEELRRMCYTDEEEENNKRPKPARNSITGY